MQPGRVTGPGAGVNKYDILTAVALAGLHGGGTAQISALRLIALITARYNWQRNELSIGQTEMARIWGVNDRTAKREVKRLVAMGLLEVRRPGVRGRVASYRLNLMALERLSRPAWASVGSDFEARAAQLLAPPAELPGKVVQVDFGSQPRSATPASADADPRWRRVLELLEESQPDAVANWYRRLDLIAATDARVEVAAPNSFVGSYVATHLAEPLQDAVWAVFGTSARVAISAAG